MVLLNLVVDVLGEPLPTLRVEVRLATSVEPLDRPVDRCRRDVIEHGDCRFLGLPTWASGVLICFVELGVVGDVGGDGREVGERLSDEERALVVRGGLQLPELLDRSSDPLAGRGFGDAGRLEAGLELLDRPVDVGGDGTSRGLASR